MDKQNTGRMGEQLAADYLREKGYQILDRNVHVGHGELDIVARQGEYLAFVEVKTRHAVPGKCGAYGTPADAVDRKKQENLVKSAEEYWKRNESVRELYPRIDVVEVYLDESDRPAAIEHYENAVRKRDIYRNKMKHHERYLP